MDILSFLLALLIFLPMAGMAKGDDTPPADPPKDPKDPPKDPKDPPADPPADPPKDPKDPPKDPADGDKYVPKEKYDELLNRVEQIEQQATERVVNERVQKAINERWIDENDENAMQSIKKLAGNDESWQAFSKTARPIVPDHIQQRRFQAKNIHSNKARHRNAETILKHQGKTTE